MDASVAPSLVVDRYALFREFASGGMGTVHFGRMTDGASTRAVAIKRLHPHLRREAAFADMLRDEARLAMSVRHPNVVEVLDVVSTDDELLLVMEYVPGLSVHELVHADDDPAGVRVPLEVAVAIVVDALRGLHAAHEAVSDDGRPLALVHRDVSPQNLIVDVDGVTKLTDFGVAKAVGRLRSTRDGAIKGKVAYMSPEQVAGARLDARADVYAAAVVLWEMLVGRPMFEAENDVALFGKAMRGPTERLASVAPGVPHALDAAVWRALSRDPRRRHDSALAFADALVESVGPGDPRRVAAWVRARGRVALEARERIVTEIVRALDRPRLETTATHAAAAPRPGVAPGAARAARPSPRVRLAALGVGFAAVIGVATFIQTRTSPRAAAAAPAPEVPAASSPEPAPAAAPPVEETPAAAQEAPARATASAAASTKRRAAAPAPPPPRRGDREPLPKNDCNPPYSIDERGGKHFKASCLR